MANIRPLFPDRTKLGHEWKVFDEHHRACLRCGMRLFWAERTNADMGGAGWRMLDFYGVPSKPLLSAGEADFGTCTPPDVSAETVLIEYTGNPDRFPGCERIMHAMPPAAAGGGLLDLGAVMPLCGVRCEFWELGPVRSWPGWTWCQDCFAGRELKHLPPPPPALSPPPWPPFMPVGKAKKPKQLGPAKKKAKKKPKK